jgi:hypothetical protein
MYDTEVMHVGFQLYPSLFLSLSHNAPKSGVNGKRNL